MAPQLLLSIDDEPHILQVRGLLLEQAGYAVLSAGNGMQALQLFGENQVDLVLLDYHMPDMDGGTVAIEMKRAKPSVPIIMVSASLGVQGLNTAPVENFVEKGQGPEVLLAEIRKLLVQENGKAT